MNDRAYLVFRLGGVLSCLAYLTYLGARDVPIHERR